MADLALFKVELRSKIREGRDEASLGAEEPRPGWRPETGERPETQSPRERIWAKKREKALENAEKKRRRVEELRGRKRSLEAKAQTRGESPAPRRPAVPGRMGREERLSLVRKVVAAQRRVRGLK